jgi:hypothetical protein
MKDNMTRERRPDEPEDPDGKTLKINNRIPPMTEPQIKVWAAGILPKLREKQD